MELHFAEMLRGWSATLFVIVVSFGNSSWLPANCVVWMVGISNILFSMKLLNCKKACVVDRKPYMVTGGRRGRDTYDI